MADNTPDQSDLDALNFFTSPESLPAAERAKLQLGSNDAGGNMDPVPTPRPAQPMQEEEVTPPQSFGEAVIRSGFKSTPESNTVFDALDGEVLLLVGPEPAQFHQLQAELIQLSAMVAHAAGQDAMAAGMKAKHSPMIFLDNNDEGRECPGCGEQHAQLSFTWFAEKREHALRVQRAIANELLAIRKEESGSSGNDS